MSASRTSSARAMELRAHQQQQAVLREQAYRQRKRERYLRELAARMAQFDISPGVVRALAVPPRYVVVDDGALHE